LSVALHAAVAAVIFTVAWQAPRQRRLFVVTPAEPPLEELPPYGGTRSNRASPGGMGREAPPIERPAPPPPELVAAPADVPDALPTAPPAAPSGWGVQGPRLGDGGLWVGPRPALPVAVADELYGSVDSLERDSVVVNRLRAMVDTLNRALDEEQRAHRLPSWVVRGDSGDPQWGLDPRNIYIAGIKIPTAVLALLGNMLPQGNYEEGLRSRHLMDMREDLLRSAQRAENYQDFRRAVRELRARKQAERDAERARRGSDTTRVVPSTP
jgi:hypothetical protein